MEKMSRFVFFFLPRVHRTRGKQHIPEKRFMADRANGRAGTILQEGK